MKKKIKGIRDLEYFVNGEKAAEFDMRVKNHLSNITKKQLQKIKELGVEIHQLNNKEKVCQGKPALHHIPYRVLEELAKALKEGNDKYGYFNYRKAGARHSVYYSSTWRHLGAWFEGTDIDKDSGLHHVLKAIAGLVVLYDSMLECNDKDDRPNTK